MSRIIKIYTDGGCDRNPGGTGGWAVRLLEGDVVLERSGREERTTNNRMELTAAIHAFLTLEEHLKGQEAPPVQIYTDSQYLVNGMTQWIGGWARRHWTLKDGSPVKNVDLWKKLLELDQRYEVDWIWVQGHAADPDNVRADKLVQEAIKGKKSERQPGRALPVEVKLLTKEGKAAGIILSQKAPHSVRLSVPWEEVQKLIEDLLRVQREGEEL